MLPLVRRSGWVGFLFRCCRRICRLCLIRLLGLSIILHHLVIECYLEEPDGLRVEERWVEIL